ncbi:ion transporter [Calothrix sp. NIES-3974]|uniref:ion transporter n=1 Tax=Calothrix sp. NIES-3974 TaxID=2005462 RepID=UPI000B5DD543|nr:ion transporter [Calothrix sp. NIES-3974]BAZ07238.1 ion transport protein [Calothrix sp. NIES-3974]
MQLSREQTAFYLKDLETPLGQLINLTIAGLVFISSAIFVTETYALPNSLLILFKTIDTIIVVIFALEYLVRLWSAEQKLAYMVSFYGIIDLIAILPYFFGAFDISFLRLFRWFRILRLIRLIDSKYIFGINSEDGVIFARILFTLFAIVFVYSGLIYQFEHPVNPHTFKTFFDAFYFSVVTMTTVGFGDVTPISQFGRILTVLMIFTGIALIPWQVGDLIKRLVKTANQIKIICSNCGLAFHDADAQYCKRCGHHLSPSK